MRLYTSKFNMIFALLGFLTATALAIAAWARMDWITLLGLLVLLLWSQYAGVGLGHLVDMVEKKKRLQAQIAEKDAANLSDYLSRQIPWSRSTFGEGVRTVGVCKHIEKELVEIQDAPTDLEEWIDVIILALDGAWRSGATPEQIVAMLNFKQQKNFDREWPTEIPPEDEPSLHIVDSDKEATNE